MELLSNLVQTDFDNYTDSPLVKIEELLTNALRALANFSENPQLVEKLLDLDVVKSVYEFLSYNDDYTEKTMKKKDKSVLQMRMLREIMRLYANFSFSGELVFINVLLLFRTFLQTD